MRTKEETSTYWKEHNAKPEVKARHAAAAKARNAKPEVKAAKKVWRESPEGKAYQNAATKAWDNTEEGKAFHKKSSAEHYASPEGHAISIAARLTFRCKKVGITVEHYNSLPKECSFPRCTVEVPGGRGDWHKGHNKITGKFRGLLCFKHNRKVSDLTLEEAEGIVEYLKKHSGMGSAYEPNFHW